jgi:hypothetical protein
MLGPLRNTHSLFVDNTDTPIVIAVRNYLKGTSRTTRDRVLPVDAKYSHMSPCLNVRKGLQGEVSSVKYLLKCRAIFYGSQIIRQFYKEIKKIR